jgi:hypothetical protein
MRWNAIFCAGSLVVMSFFLEETLFHRPIGGREVDGGLQPALESEKVVLASRSEKPAPGTETTSRDVEPASYQDLNPAGKD